jgi:hypothetical protein
MKRLIILFSVLFFGCQGEVNTVLDLGETQEENRVYIIEAGESKWYSTSLEFSEKVSGFVCWGSEDVGKICASKERILLTITTTDKIPSEDWDLLLLASLCISLLSGILLGVILTRTYDYYA